MCGERTERQTALTQPRQAAIMEAGGNMFKAGDKVRVVDAPTFSDPDKRFRNGEILTVNRMEGGFVYLESTPRNVKKGGWLPSRFELVKEQNMATDYPTDLEVGDVLVTSTGREYTVAAVNNGRVHYAYIPAKYDHRSEKKLSVDTRRLEDLKWVDSVLDSNGNCKWPNQYEVGTLVVGNVSGRKGIVVSSAPIKVWWEGLDHAVKELPSFIKEA